MSRSQNDDLYELRQRYDIKETIGSGGFGKVKRAIHLPTGETVAIKVLISHLRNLHRLRSNSNNFYLDHG